MPLAELGWHNGLDGWVGPSEWKEGWEEDPEGMIPEGEPCHLGDNTRLERNRGKRWDGRGEGDLDTGKRGEERGWKGEERVRRMTRSRI